MSNQASANTSTQQIQQVETQALIQNVQQTESTGLAKRQ